jgi:hypothetical protein
MPADDITLTIRSHDPLEKRDVSMSACWINVKIPRQAIGSNLANFVELFITPNLGKLKNLKLQSPAPKVGA